MRNPIYLLPAVLFFILAGYFALSLRPDRDPHELPSAMIDKPVPAFDLIALAGGDPLTGATFAGKVVVINFFASWCVPCRIEHPILMRLAVQDHIFIYGIAYKDKVTDSTKLLTDSGNPYTRVGVDADGRTGIDFGVYGVPETYVIDRAGHIRRRFVGPLTAEVVDNELLPLVRELNRS